MTHWSRAILLLMAPLPSVPAAAAGPRPSPALATLLAEDWEYHLSRSPTYASILGDRRWNDRWDDLSLAGPRGGPPARRRLPGEAREADQGQALRRRPAQRRAHRPGPPGARRGLRARAPVPPARTTCRGLPEGTGEFPGVQNAGQLGKQLRFTTLEDYRDWVARLDGFGAYVDQTIALLQGRRPAEDGLAAGGAGAHPSAARRPHRRRADGDALLRAVHPDAGVAPRGRAQELAQTAERLIRERVQPAYRRLRDFVVGTYLPAAPAEVGVGRWPDGERLYAWCVRGTTPPRTSPPEQAHQLGLSEVARIRAEMEAVKAQGGLQGHAGRVLPAPPDRPPLLLQDGDELLLHSRDLAKRIDPRLVRLFGTLPAAPYGVEPTPAAMAPDATTGFYYPARRTARAPAPTG